MDPRKKQTTQCLLVGALLLLAPAAQAGLALIVHPSNTETQLTLDQAQQIYLGRLTALPRGGKIKAVEQKDGSPTKEKFYATVLKKDAAQMRSYWSKLIFSGQGVPPAVAGDDGDVKNWVARNSNGLGYVDSAVVDSSVKVLLTVP